ncbi:MAG: hypothetical protein D6712_16485 [Chloroflexi bacterium]|nr:MAG: hypothetical protein D6712_16485 [Chloroflexota bacterium]
MTIQFTKDFGKYKKGHVLRDVYRGDAVQLIADGVAREYTGNAVHVNFVVDDGKADELKPHTGEGGKKSKKSE